MNASATIRRLHLLTIIACAATFALPVFGSLNLSYNGAGSDGVFAPNLTSVGVVDGVLTIDLSHALDGDWDHAVTAEELAAGSAVYGRGVYDKTQWAVVFKYESVNIPDGLTVLFNNHPSRAPVVWLVNTTVTIAGTVDLSGRPSVSAPLLAEPGPGGFRGAKGYVNPIATGSAGFGPGGGTVFGPEYFGRFAGAGGTYGTPGQFANSPAYGNPSLIPLIGGSGGGSVHILSSETPEHNMGGGGGGGALLIASPETVTLTGSILANGGDGRLVSNHGADRSSAGGSGGGIRLIAATVIGGGRVEALGGAGGHADGGSGRIRIERVSVDESQGILQIQPDPSVVALQDNDAPLLWPPSTAPSVRILSVGGEAVPDDPRASFGALGPDMQIPETAATSVVVETVNVEATSEVFVRVGNRTSDYVEVKADAASSNQVNADPLTIHWTVSLPVEVGYSALQVRVVRP